MAKVIIFGVQDFAQLARFYLRHDSEHEVIAFSVNEQYLPVEKTFDGLPVVAFESVEKTYSPSKFRFFAPMSPKGMNTLRENVYNQIKEKGYQLISYLSSKATVFPDVKIGDNCFVLEDNTIQPYTSIGNNVVLWSGNHIGHHMRDRRSRLLHFPRCLVRPLRRRIARIFWSQRHDPRQCAHRKRDARRDVCINHQRHRALGSIQR